MRDSYPIELSRYQKIVRYQLGVRGTEGGTFLRDIID